MPRIDTWANLPPSVRQHLVDRMRDRAIGIPDLNRLTSSCRNSPRKARSPWSTSYGNASTVWSAPMPGPSVSWSVCKTLDATRPRSPTSRRPRPNRPLRSRALCPRQPGPPQVPSACRISQRIAPAASIVKQLQCRLRTRAEIPIWLTATAGPADWNSCAAASNAAQLRNPEERQLFS